MPCCVEPARVKGTNRFFNKFASSYARSFRRGKLEKIQRILVEGLERAGLQGISILEIGCGVGALHQHLLARGAKDAVGVDISDEMLAEARRFAAERELSERTSYHVGDFAALAPELATAEVTLLDKVVCCYPDADQLVSASLEKTGRVYALTHPRNFFGIRWAFAAHRFLARLLRWQFFPCWHEWHELGHQIERAGFRPVHRGRTFLWEAAVYSRVS